MSWAASLRWFFVIAAFALLVWAVSCSTAQAQAPCGQRVVALAHLKEKYHEEIVATATTESGGILEFTASLSGSWSLLASDPASGMTCLVMSGANWAAKSWPGSDT